MIEFFSQTSVGWTEKNKNIPVFKLADKMKVTVYFGNVRVIVPCGQGDILVRELMDLAITRYKKATGKVRS